MPEREKFNPENNENVETGNQPNPAAAEQMRPAQIIFKSKNQEREQVVPVSVNLMRVLGLPKTKIDKETDMIYVSFDDPQVKIVACSLRELEYLYIAGLPF